MKDGKTPRTSFGERVAIAVSQSTEAGGDRPTFFRRFVLSTFRD
jgi:hypothetical protein